MNFLIADTFTTSFNRLSGLDQNGLLPVSWTRSKANPTFRSNSTGLR